MLKWRDESSYFLRSNRADQTMFERGVWLRKNALDFSLAGRQIRACPMTYDFDTIIPRRGTGNIKYDRRPELDPFWVADMDFASAPEITESIIARAKHPIYGYAQAHEGLIEATLSYLHSRHGVTVASEHLVWLGGLVPALSLAVKAFCRAGEAVMTCTPSYPPFLNVHHDAREVELISIPHAKADGHWTFDFAAMEAAITPKTRLFLLSNPQNPLGRVFTRKEMLSLAAFCQRHDLILVSDEIHCDLVFDETNTPHVCGHSLPAEFHDRIITLLSPSKTYNIAGIGIAYAVITDDSLKRRFSAARGHTLAEINTFGYYAAEAAYRHGEPWRQQLLAYLSENQNVLLACLSEHAPELVVNRNEATYLTWIDCRAYALENPALHFEKEAGLFLSDGAFFGVPGYVRFNFACPRVRMLEGLEKMAKVLP
jgi:cystathionine beta-lyase